MAGLIVVATAAALAPPGLGADSQDNWTIPADAADLKSPAEPTPALLKKGASIFESRCRPCHGPEGKGNGPLSDPSRPAADLTAGLKADLLPDGVLFYKVWNGRRPMPAFKSELSRDDVWAVVEHIKTLKK
jgi:mono/diheme cytochrome c family protein